MLTCDQGLELISAQLDGVITAEELQELEAHIATCPACRQLVQDLAEIHGMTADMMVEPPAFIKENIMAQITPKATKKVISFPMIARRSMGLVAVVALVFLGGRVLVDGSNSSDSASSSSFSSSTTSTSSSSSSFSSAVTSGTDGSTFAAEDEPMMAAATEADIAERAVGDFDFEEDTSADMNTVESTMVPDAVFALGYLVDYLGGEEAYPDGAFDTGDVSIELGQRIDSDLYTGIYYRDTTPEGDIFFVEYSYTDDQYTEESRLEESSLWRVTVDGTVTLEDSE